jgi:primosomal protein N'
MFPTFCGACFSLKAYPNGMKTSNVYYGRREEISKQSEEQKRQTLYEWFDYNRAQRTAVHLLSAQNSFTQTVTDTVTGDTETGEPNASN